MVTPWLVMPELAREAALWPSKVGQHVGTWGGKGQSACESNGGCSEVQGVL